MSKRPTDVNAVRPTSISHVVGQRGVVEQIKVALDAAQQDSRRADHALLVGPPGCGKTSVAQVIAEEMAVPFIEVLGQSIKGIADLNAVLLSAKEDGTIIFIDEASELRDKALQIALYLAIDQRKILLNGRQKGTAPISIPLVDFTLLLATTDEYELLQPLRDRMRLVLRFQFYSNEELTTLLRIRCASLGWEVEPEVLPAIAIRSRGTPRLGLRVLSSGHRVSRSLGEDVIRLEHLQRACALEELDQYGCGPTEQEYLRLLADGPMRLNVIASAVGLPARTISQVTEPFLIRAGLVTKDDQSRRQLTALGHEHVSKSRRNTAHLSES
jgi:holliday junction DNA helicase RuvB